MRSKTRESFGYFGEKKEQMAEFSPSPNMRRLIRMVLDPEMDHAPSNAPLTTREFQLFASEYEKDTESVQQAIQQILYTIDTPFTLVTQKNAEDAHAQQQWMSEMHTFLEREKMCEVVFRSLIGNRDQEPLGRREVQELERRYPLLPFTTFISLGVNALSSQEEKAHALQHAYAKFMSVFYGQRWEYQKAWDQGIREFVLSRTNSFVEQEPVWTPSKFHRVEQGKETKEQIQAKCLTRVARAIEYGWRAQPIDQTVYTQEDWDRFFRFLNRMVSENTEHGSMEERVNQYLCSIPTLLDMANKQDLASGNNNREQAEAFLKRIQNNPSLQRMREVLCGLFEQGKTEPITLTMAQALQEHWPLPTDIAAPIALFIDREKPKDQEESLHTQNIQKMFGEVFYGERYTMNLAWQDIRKQYIAWLKQKASLAKNGSRKQDIVPLPAPMSSAHDHLQEFNDEQTEMILSTQNIIVCGVSERKTIDWLSTKELEPKFSALFEGNAWYFSSLFTLPTGSGERPGVLVYVPETKMNTHGGITESWIARPYYLGNTSGLWRFRHGYGLEAQGKTERVGGGGVGDISRYLPFALQAQLAQVMQRGHAIAVRFDAEEILRGVSDRAGEYPIPTYKEILQEVEPRRIGVQQKFRRGFAGDEKELPPDPETIGIKDRQDAPDFQRKIYTWSVPSHLYEGRISFEVFPSLNGRQQFAFASDAHDRFWLAGVQDMTTPITSVGLRAGWVDIGAADTPAIEYHKTETTVFARKDNTGEPILFHGQYIDIYQKFVSHIPIVRTYREWKKSSVH